MTGLKDDVLDHSSIILYLSDKIINNLNNIHLFLVNIFTDWGKFKNI